MLRFVVLADWDHGRMMDHGGGTGWWWLVGVATLAALFAVVALIVWLVTRTAHATNVTPDDPNFGAKQILSERLARGEIDPAEYRERLSHLS